MRAREQIAYACPACGETNIATVDLDGGRVQEFVEDCGVCCRPAVLYVEVEPRGRVRLEARPE